MRADAAIQIRISRQRLPSTRIPFACLIPMARQVRDFRHRDLFYRLLVHSGRTKASPLNSDFFSTTYCDPWQMADRDLRWSEFLPEHGPGIAQADVARLEQRWKDGRFIERADQLRASLRSCGLLRAQCAIFRDHATKGSLLFWQLPPGKHFFNLAIESLEVNDPYVPERMLAACYGVAMGFWADPRGDKMRRVLPSFARKLVDEMFVDGAPHSTFHSLMTGYALGIINLAQKIDRNCIPEAKRGYLSAPFTHFNSSFPPANKIADVDLEPAKQALHMDFENYTLGHLVRHRSNYDYTHEGYKEEDTTSDHLSDRRPRILISEI